MRFDDFIRNLQKKPYAVRLRILWSTTIIVAVVLLAVWVATIKNGADSLAGQDLFTITQESDQAEEARAEESDHISVERVETTKAGAFQIFFKIKNSSNDILNFSPLEKITLEINKTNLKPLEILDRQGNPFVRKILSNTENFGTLIFTGVEGKSGTLSFEGLFLEQKPQTLFREILNLDFEELNQIQELRN
jgi:hypothetical protein